MIKLYTSKGSGNGFKIRVMLSLLGLAFEEIVIYTADGEHKKAPYLAINPRGQVPTLDDDGTIVWDSMAILVYLARKYGGETWLPTDPKGMAEVTQWLALAANEIQYGLQYARGILKGIRKGDYDDYAARARLALDVLEKHLQSNAWLACGRPTIADIACHSYVALADEAKLPLANYPAASAWIGRLAALPNYPQR